MLKKAGLLLFAYPSLAKQVFSWVKIAENSNQRQLKWRWMASVTLTT